MSMNSRSMISQRGWRVVAGVIAGMLLSVAAAPLAQAQTFSLTTGEQIQEAELAAKAMDAIKAMPPGSSSGAYESAIIETLSGYSPLVIEAAMAQVAGTPGIPAAAVEAARRVGRVFASLDFQRDRLGPGGFFGAGSTPGINDPLFLTGGGGGTSSSYTR